VLGALEDSGFIALDNVPVQLLGPLLEIEGGARLAVGMDSRRPEFAGEFAPMVGRLRAQGTDPFVLYLDCEDEVIVRRYSESRRPHSMAGGGGVADGIAAERAALRDAMEAASCVLDTSRLTLHQLRRRVAGMLPMRGPGRTSLEILSFGFKHGVPREADAVFDARILPNPFYVPELRPLTGQDAEVLAFLEKSAEFGGFLDRVEDWVAWSWPRVLEAAKAYHTVAIGCTGGRHRSVALAEGLAARLGGRIGGVRVRHREL